MRHALRLYAGLIDALATVERSFGVFLIGLIVVTITIQVFTRYFLNYPIVWVEELATYAFIWGAFVGAALGHKHQRHIRIDTFVGRLPPRGVAAMRLAANLLALLLFYLLARAAMTVMGVEARSRSIALPIDIPRMWFYSVPLFTSVVSMAITSVYFVLAEATTLVTGEDDGRRRGGGESIA
ncbi:MAG: TRAP transporter small permease subunit [Alphaproteobacteria bacterium]|nr:TRAP transporter small permease subunit [Alphaproteobacteria bacterium]